MNQIEQLRSKISKVDAKLISLIAKRQQIARKIGDYKRQYNLPIVDQAREVMLREYHNTLCEEYNLSSIMVARIFEILIEESIKVQENEQ